MSKKSEDKLGFPIHPFFSWACTEEEFLQLKENIKNYDGKTAKTLLHTDFIRLQAIPIDKSGLLSFGVQCAANSTKLSKQEIQGLIDKHPEMKELVEKIKEELQ